MEFPNILRSNVRLLCCIKQISLQLKWFVLLPSYWNSKLTIVYNYPPKGRWKVVDIYRDAKRWGIYPPFFTDPEGDSCFSIYQIRWKKIHFFNFFFWNFRERTRHFSLCSQNSEYPRIFRVTGANQNTRKLQSTDLANTNNNYYFALKLVTCEHKLSVQLSLQAKLLLFSAACRRGLYVITMENDPLASLMCQNCWWL